MSFYLLFTLACGCASICVLFHSNEVLSLSTVPTVNDINLYAQTVCCRCYCHRCLPLSISIHSLCILTCSAYFFHIHTYMRVSKCVVCVHSVVKFKIYAIFCSLRQKAFNSFPLAFHFTSEHLAKRSSICRLIENKWIFNEDEMEWTPTIQGMLPKGGHLLKRHFIKAACAVIWHVSICYY